MGQLLAIWSLAINTDAMKELRMLSALHGIGVIQLDPKIPPTSTHAAGPGTDRLGHLQLPDRQKYRLGSSPGAAVLSNR